MRVNEPRNGIGGADEERRVKGKEKEDKWCR
jgi:hypothetical protein